MSSDPRLTPETDALARLLWSYHRLGMRLAKADVILALGSNDPRVAEHAALLWKDGWAPWLVCSGNVGALTEGLYGKTEAAAFADIAAGMGVPREVILLEERATNTGENVSCCRTLLENLRLPRARIIAVQKPYMERRTWATFKQVWPEPELWVSSPPLTWDEYPLSPHLERARVIEIMVGDLQRIREYPGRGFQIPQDIPADVWAAYERLVVLGFTGHLMRA